MRLNIEEQAFGDGRLSKLTNILEVDIHHAIGILVVLWHDSQEAEKTHGSRVEIIDWCRIYNNAAWANQIFEALVACKYIIPTTEDLYEIRGNKSQIDAKRRYVERSQKGAEATRQKWQKVREEREEKDLEATSTASSSATSPPTSGQQVLLNSMQCNSMQNNKIHVEPDGPTRPKFDFEEIYQLYPRHEGKSEGLKRCKKEIKTPEDFDLLKTAVTRYRTHVAKKKTEPEFIKLFSTFMTSWRDCLDQDFGSVSIKAPPSPPDPLEPEWQYMRSMAQKYGIWEETEAFAELGKTRSRAVEILGGWGDFMRLGDDDLAKARTIKAIKQAQAEESQQGSNF